jgi:hypothetical protein
MFYEFSLTIPPNTAQVNEILKECIVCYGVINKIEVQFPSGCAGFAHLAIDRNTHQILPTNIDEYFTSDDTTITTDEEIEIRDKPFMLRIRGYNTDDTYTHTIYVRVYVALKGEGVQMLTAVEVSRNLIEELG